MPAKKRKRNASTSRGLPADPKGWLTGQLTKTKIVKRGGRAILVKSNGRRNVEMGFYNQTGFHPIRASADYDPEADFGDYKSPKKKGKAKKKNPKRRSNCGGSKNPRKKKKVSWQKRVYAGAKSNPTAAFRRKLAEMKPGKWYDTKLSGVRMKVKRNGGTLTLRKPTKRTR